MKRDKGQIILTEAEINCLHRKLFGEPVPNDQDLEDAAQACAFVAGTERVELYLNDCRREGML